MITKTNLASCPDEYLTAFGLDPDKVIYFDIETTGFRASTSSLYMIGWTVRINTVPYQARAVNTNSAPEHIRAVSTDSAIYQMNQTDTKLHPDSSGFIEKSWLVTQMMAESASEEALLLDHFRNIMARYDTIIEYNGDRFDLPYLRDKYEAYGMEDPFQHCRTVDLYHEIRPIKKALGLTKLNQKSVEKFLSITREDPYNGGELIDVYRSVRDGRIEGISEEESAVNALFLHNYEDVLGMLAMTPLLAYPLAIQSNAAVTAIQTCTDPEMPVASYIWNKKDALQSKSAGIIEATFELPVPVPKPLHLTYEEYIDITLTDYHVKVILRPFSGSMYHFFPDYRNYYYLPEEDTAIHKSVASFVAASHREKAKAQSCYVKKQGTFLPLAGESKLPAFQRYYKDPVLWFEYTPDEKPDSAAFSEYIHRLIRDLVSG